MKWVISFPTFKILPKRIFNDYKKSSKKCCLSRTEGAIRKNNQKKLYSSCFMGCFRGNRAN
jgi:hypothetical protein